MDIFGDETRYGAGRLFGWWVDPTGVAVDGEEVGFHGYTARDLLGGFFAARGLAYAEDDFDQCIADAKALGFVRVSTFHGSACMHFDYDPDAVTAGALRGAIELMRNYREHFDSFILEFEDGVPREILTDARVVRLKLTEMSKRAPAAPAGEAVARVASAPAPSLR